MSAQSPARRQIRDACEVGDGNAPGEPMTVTILALVAAPAAVGAGDGAPRANPTPAADGRPRRAAAVQRAASWRMAWISIVALLTARAVMADETVAAGRTLYVRYCSACHGAAAEGDGMVGQLITPHPIDLTLLAERNGGTFPFDAVVESIDGRRTVRAHGAPNMPVWGEILSHQPTPELSGETVTRTKILAITSYLQSIQRK